MIYNFESQLKKNPLGQQEDENHDYYSYKKTSLKKARQPLDDLSGQVSNLTIQKSQFKAKVQVLELIHDDDKQEKHQPCLADFLDDEEEIIRSVEKDSQDSKVDADTPQGLIDDMPNFADFLEDDDIPKSEPIEKGEATQMLKLDNNILEVKDERRQEIGMSKVNYYVTRPLEFLQSEIMKNVNIKVSFSYLTSGQTQRANLFLGDHQILQCIGSGNSFIFQSTEGFVGYMEIIGSVYHLYIFTNSEDMSSKLHCSIKVERKTIGERKFSSIKIQYYSNHQESQQSVKVFRSRDPFINNDGKLQLRISNPELVRPSAFNCIIEDSEGREICSLLHTNLYNLNITHPFTVLLGCAVALARIDWSSREAKLRCQ